MPAKGAVFVMPKHRPIEVLTAEMERIKSFRRHVVAALKTADEQLAELRAELRATEAANSL